MSECGAKGTTEPAATQAWTNPSETMGTLSLFAFRIFFVSLATSSGVATTQYVPGLHSVAVSPPYAAITDSTALRAPMLEYFDEARQNTNPENIAGAAARQSGRNRRKVMRHHRINAASSASSLRSPDIPPIHPPA